MFSFSFYAFPFFTSACRIYGCKLTFYTSYIAESEGSITTTLIPMLRPNKVQKTKNLLFKNIYLLLLK